MAVAAALYELCPRLKRYDVQLSVVAALLGAVSATIAQAVRRLRSVQRRRILIRKEPLPGGRAEAAGPARASVEVSGR
jgi:hypothetical protein